VFAELIVHPVADDVAFKPLVDVGAHGDARSRQRRPDVRQCHAATVDIHR
jgi:hypothetical protein